MREVLTIAHRGFPYVAPENTLASFTRAMELSPDLIECDVRSTVDGKLVVIHDPTVDRTTNGSGAVSDMTLEQLRQLDAGLWFGEQFAGERIPTIEEVLDVVHFPTRLIIELKEEGLEDRLLEILGSRGACNSVMIASFHHHIGARMHLDEEKIPFIPLFWCDGQPNEQNAVRIADEASNVHGSMLGINFKAITPSLVRATHAANLSIMAWTVDQENDIRSMVDLDIDAIASNRPDILIGVLQELGVRSTARAA